jgi:hypothetical protein
MFCDLPDTNLTAKRPGDFTGFVKGSPFVV